jgi:phosphopantothenoylcysteine decarboxylase/phosphopantothenate--cysteine ligase
VNNKKSPKFSSVKKNIVDKGVATKSSALFNRRIALGISGGIGAVELVKVARELRRHGAEVHAFFTPSVTRFISEMSIEWATGNKVVAAADADVTHLDEFDLVVVAPATLNTIAKCAVGISDNAVTLLVAGQLGRRAPVLFIPTMNIQLRQHPAFGPHQKTLRDWGARFFESTEAESRLKMPTPEEIAREAQLILK